MSSNHWSRDSDDFPIAPLQDDLNGDKNSDLGTRPIGSASVDKRDLGTRPMSEAPPRKEGRLVDGLLLQERYRILGVIGAGGMSTVYKAQDMRFTQVVRVCALKEMLNTSSDIQTRQRNLLNFEREASLLATLRHPAIPQVYDYFTDGEHSYLVLEFVPGRDLETLLDMLDETPSEAQVVTWMLQVCEVLIYLHSQKPHPIIFRDVKPSNIMVDDNDRVHLIDFGIAKVFQGGHKGTMIGTEGYSPPEQYRGIADPRGDIYSLGATMHHLLTRQDPRLEPPFSFQERPIRRVNMAVSDELIAIIERSLEYDASKRYATIEELYQALSSLRTARRTTTLSFTTAFSQPGTTTPIWEFACEDEVRASPVVDENVVYVGAYDNNLYALEASSGKFQWKYPTEGGIGSSPCVAEKKIFFGSQDYALYALGADLGRLMWTCPTGGPVYSSPRAQMGYVFFGSDDHRFYAVKSVSGRIAWSFEADAPVRSSPAIGREGIYFGDEAGSVYAIGAGGKLLWRFHARRAVTSSPLLVEDILFVGSRDAHLYAVDARAGWDIWRYRTGGPIISSPAYGESAVFVGSADGEVYAIKASNGQVMWRYKTGGQVTSSPAYFGGAVYIGSTDGTLYSIEAKSGKLRWRFQAGGPIISSPCVAHGLVFIGSIDSKVYALPA